MVIVLIIVLLLLAGRLWDGAVPAVSFSLGPSAAVGLISASLCCFVYLAI